MFALYSRFLFKTIITLPLDSAPSSITYQSSLSTRAPLSDFTEQGARPKSSGMTKLSSIEIHREESGLFPLHPAGGIHRNRDETSSSSLRPVHGPQRSTDLSEHSGTSSNLSIDQIHQNFNC